MSPEGGSQRKGAGGGAAPGHTAGLTGTPRPWLRAGFQPLLLGHGPEHPGHGSTAGPKAAAPTKGCGEHRLISGAFSNGNATADVLRALAPSKQKGAAPLLGEQGELPAPCR